MVARTEKKMDALAQLSKSLRGLGVTMRAPVRNPGSRGGKGYRDEHYNWHYGERPTGHESLPLAPMPHHKGGKLRTAGLDPNTNYTVYANLHKTKTKQLVVQGKPILDKKQRPVIVPDTDTPGEGFVWSAKNKRTGHVEAHIDKEVVLADVKAEVLQSGRRRAINEGRKNVHAGLAGKPVKDAGVLPKEGWVPITYNPFMNPDKAKGFFVRKDTKERVTHAKFARLMPHGAEVWGPMYEAHSDDDAPYIAPFGKEVVLVAEKSLNAGDDLALVTSGIGKKDSDMISTLRNAGWITAAPELSQERIVLCRHCGNPVTFTLLPGS